MKTDITSRLEALEKRLKGGTDLYFVDLIDGAYRVDSQSYSPVQFAEWCRLHQHSTVIIDDLEPLPNEA